ncbi:MAG: hypothetical protein ABMA00_17770 [Gemmatimonas sp.]
MKFTFRPVSPGKQKGGVLCVHRSRVLRHEVVDGEVLALVPMSSFEPDRYFRKGATITADELAALRREFLVVRNGWAEYVDSNGGSYNAFPIATAAPPKTVST